MALAANSYSTVREVTALCRRFLDGAPEFDESTRPTLAEIETFIDTCSQELNDALAAVGFAIPITGNQKLVCDKWVTTKAAMWVEMTAPYTGYDGADANRIEALNTIAEDARTFAQSKILSWKRQGVTVADPSHQGLTFTGFDKHSERSDPDSSTLEQPMFRRGQFDP